VPGTVRVFALALAALFLLRREVLFDPPYWDALLGAFPQGLWLARHGFDVVRLLVSEKTYVDGGPNVYPFSVYPLIVGALYRSGLSVERVFLVLHLLSFVSAAALVAGLYRLARAALPALHSALLALVLFTSPLFAALACQSNMDMPLAACTVLSALALHEGRTRAAGWWALAALLVKPTGIILVAANLGALACGALSDQPLVPDRARAVRAALAHLALAALFVAEVGAIVAYGRPPAFVEPLGGLATLFGRRLWFIPEYGLAIAVFLASVPWAARRLWRGELSPLELQAGVFLCAFVFFFAQYTNPLPRYFLQSYPFVLLWLALLLSRWPRWLAALSLLASAYHVANQDGRFYPSRPAAWEVPGDPRPLWGNDGYVLERSMEYRDDLALNRKIAERLERHPRDRTVIVANWPLVHVLAIPEFGYTPRAFAVASPDNPLSIDERRVDYWTLYDTSRDPPRRRTDDTILWVITPNTFVSPQSRLLPEVDEILETVESGDRRAFILARRGWE
jgi:hypothetical protein